MASYKKILLPVDFSKPTSHAAERARQLADHYGAELITLHVVDYIPPAYVSVELPSKAYTKEMLVEKATEYMKEWLEENGLQDRKNLIEVGKPKKIIPQVIDNLNIDLVVLAPHDDSAFVRLFGSVTNAVAQHTECDVLILKSS